MKNDFTIPFLCFGNFNHKFIVFHDESGPLFGLDKPCRLARTIRTTNIHAVTFGEEMCISFGATGDDDMTDAKQDGSTDPWTKQDPWSVGRQRLAKWEDLRLRDDHEFHSGQDRLQQVVRQQLGPTKGGIAFATKTSFANIFQMKPKATTVLIVPNNDRKYYSNFCSPDDIKGPIEIVVVDPLIQSNYKRSVLIICLSGSLEIKREKPTYNVKLDPVKEMVLEIDNRITSKECIAALSVKPLDTIRTKVNEQFGTKAAGCTIFGHRVIRRSPDTTVHQAMIKIPEPLRGHFLEMSGTSDLFCRDFSHDFNEVTDVTTIPKFFEVSKSARDNAIKATTRLDGYAGLTLTKRGLAVRSYKKGLKGLRQILLPNDERLIELNLGVFPKMLYEASGWPTSITASAVVKATNHALGSPPIPTRCSRASGVNSWGLAFEDEPSALSFTALFDNEHYEIILTKVDKQAFVPKKSLDGKGKAKGQSKGSKSSNQGAPEELTGRVTALEARFGTLEKRTDNIESKLSSGFDSVQNQLRQVLAVLQPRPAEAATGMTPPPKSQRLE